MEYQISVKPWLYASQEAIPVRFDVFVREQSVPQEIEIDEDDVVAWHVLALTDSGCIGTARLVIEGDKSPNPIGRVGRMAVLKSNRKHGVGAALLKALIQFGTDKQINEYYLHAQLTAENFYSQFGFIAEGDVFEEAGILHRTMRLKI